MPFWNFRQNNSGGSFVFDSDRGISVNVIVEAENVHAACERAKHIGLYFDGCRDGYDCNCCGDRWSRPYDDNGDPIPMIYDHDVSDGQYHKSFSWQTMYSKDNIEGYIHYLDKRVVPVRFVDQDATERG